MPEPFKNNFSPDLVVGLAHMLKAQLPEFDEDQFNDFVLDDFASLELKQRSARITDALLQFMPSDLVHCESIIENVIHPEDIEELSTTQSDEKGLRGWMIMPVADFVSQRWLNTDFLQGLRVLKMLTRRFSAEFAIRDFILADQDKALTEVYTWLNHDNEHIRRLASEGTRPRLPWGKQLPALIADPKPLTTILESLLDDGSEYVRRSVANNLNDIAKDNPEFVLQFVSKFYDAKNQQRTRLLKHACRSLFKQGDPRILALFDFEGFSGEVHLNNPPSKVEWGGDLHFEIEIKSSCNKPQNIMLDYVVWHQKANGNLTPKVFKWKVIEGFMGNKKIKKKHSFRAVTTRKYYPGAHRVDVQINGKVYDSKDFFLLDI